jgi:phosphoribosylformylglycinamidine synthase subunit PurS
VKARVTIFYKDSVFDPQGNTLAQSLRRVGFTKVGDVRVGKVVDLQLSHGNRADAEGDLRKMCDELLANPVIESYQYEIQG